MHPEETKTLAYIASGTILLISLIIASASYYQQQAENEKIKIMMENGYEEVLNAWGNKRWEKVKHD